MVVAGYVITLNEEGAIEEAVRSLMRVASIVLVLDSGSSDHTAELARAAGAQVRERTFDGYASQRNAAIQELVSIADPDWVIALDADEVLDENLIEQIPASLASGEADAFLVRRRIRFSGRRLRFGGTSRTKLLRVFRPDYGRYEDREVNEHFETKPGARVRTLKGTIEHRDVTSWYEHISKHNRYSSLEASARVRIQDGAGAVELSEAFKKPQLRRRWMRERIFNRLPAKPALRFVYIYVLLGGFLDGRAGFRYALFNAWQEMATDAKYEELLKARNAQLSDE